MEGNRDNSYRRNNKRALIESGRKMYNKRYMSKLIHDAIYSTLEVHLTQLSDEDIARIKKDKKSDRPNEDVIDILDAPELNESNHIGEKSDETSLELVSSIEPTSQIKTIDTKNCKKLVTKEKKKNAKKIKKNNNKDTKKKDNKDNIIIVDSESSNSSIEFIEITYNNPIEARPSTSTSKIGKIRCCDMKTLIDASKLEKFYKCFGLSNPNPSRKNKKKSSVTNANNLIAQNSIHTNNLSIREIESLYHKYITKSVQYNIHIIANILHIITVSNRHHMLRMDETYKLKSEVNKRKRRCHIDKIHSRHKTVLDTKLKKYFLEVISTFSHSDFEPAFKIFYLAISSVLRILDEPTFNFLKRLGYSLIISLKNDTFDFAKIIEMLREKNFVPDCLILNSTIENHKKIDSGIADRMELLCLSSVNSRECFQTSVNAVTTAISNENLEVLIDRAALQYRNNSAFKGSLDLPSTSTFKRNESVITPMTPVASTSKNYGPTWVLAKAATPSITAPPVNKSINNTSTMTQPSNSTQSHFYGNVSKNIVRASTATVVPLNLVPLVPNLTRITTSPAVFNGPVQNVNSLFTLQNPIRNVRSVSLSNIQRPGNKTVLVGSKQYYVPRSPMNQIGSVSTQSGIVMMNPVRRPESKKCNYKNCQNVVKLMCSDCKSVKYCSCNCQRLDWHYSHANNCQQLKNLMEGGR